MKNKIIFFVKDFIVGGVEQVLVSAANTLVENGDDVVIVWTGYVEDNFMLRKIDKRVKQIYTSKIWHLVGKTKPQGAFSKVLYHIKQNLNLFMLRFIKKHIPDFSSYNYLIDFKNGSSKIFNISLEKHQQKIVWLHGAFSRFYKKDKFKTYKLNLFDKIVCLTENFQKQYSEKYPTLKEKIKVVRNPFAIEDIKNKADDTDEETSQYMPYFLHVSRIDKDKDILTALKAYKTFYEKTKSNKKLIFLGNGPLLEYYKKWVFDNGLEGKIFFLGNRSNPFVWMKNSEALILSSLNEGLPTVLIEGQICSTLVISSDCESGPDEILEHGKSGVLFKVNDSDDLANILTNYEQGLIDKETLVRNANKSLNRFGKEEFKKQIYFSVLQ